jgi:hypothetical protein
MLLAKDEGAIREKPSTGMHDAVLVFVANVGTHVEKTQWGDKAQHKVVFCWEIDEKLKDGEYAGKPFMVSKRYTFTLFEKGNLSKDLESWGARKISDETRKNGIDLEAFIGKKCTLNLVESADGKYINIGAVLPASKDNSLIPVCKDTPKWIDKLRQTSLEMQKQQTENGEPLSQDSFNQEASSGLPF